MRVPRSAEYTVKPRRLPGSWLVFNSPFHPLLPPFPPLFPSVNSTGLRGFYPLCSIFPSSTSHPRLASSTLDFQCTRKGGIAILCWSLCLAGQLYFCSWIHSYMGTWWSVSGKRSSCMSSCSSEVPTSLHLPLYHAGRPLVCHTCYKAHLDTDTAPEEFSLYGAGER